MISLSKQAADFQQRETIVNPVPAASTQFIGPDSSRVALLLQASSGGAVFVSPVHADENLFLGFALNTGVNPVEFLFKDWGAVMQGAWFCSSTSITAVLYCLESFYRPAGIVPDLAIEEVGE